ncbi:MAG: hypothetical protein N3A62_08845 [Thermodesulfovibrionales bacterium]|nr:hypothetical protein [Thermodesulfovibrionales bacterium]
MARKIFILTIIALLIYLPLLAQQEPSKQPSQPAERQKDAKSLEEERLSIIKSDIQKELEQLKKLKKEIEDLQKMFEEKVEMKDTQYLAQLAKMYESMQPEEAARRLEKLDDDTAVTIMTALKPKTAGRILAQIDDSRAAVLSKKILTRARIKQEKPIQ